MELGCFSFLLILHCLEQFRYFWNFQGFLGGSEEVRFVFLVGRSSSAVGIGLFMFVMEVFQDGCKSFRLFS